MKNIVQLLEPFKCALEMVSAEKNVTISLIIPIFEKLKSHLQASTHDSNMIKDMKTHMLSKLGTRYTLEQTQFLQTCSLLDVRYKSKLYLEVAIPKFKKDVQQVCEKDQIAKDK